MSFDEATCLERRQRRSHRLHADLLSRGQLCHRGRTASIQSLEGRDLRQAQVALSLHLTKLSYAQANAHLQSRSNVIDSWILRHLPRLALLDKLASLAFLSKGVAGETV